MTPDAPPPDETPNVLIVSNGGKWYVRRVACVGQDDTRDEMVYHCDLYIGGPFPTIGKAAGCLSRFLESVVRT